MKRQEGARDNQAQKYEDKLKKMQDTIQRNESVIQMLKMELQQVQMEQVRRSFGKQMPFYEAFHGNQTFSIIQETAAERDGDWDSNHSEKVKQVNCCEQVGFSS